MNIEFDQIDLWRCNLANAKWYINWMGEQHSHGVFWHTYYRKRKHFARRPLRYTCRCVITIYNCTYTYCATVVSGVCKRSVLLNRTRTLKKTLDLVKELLRSCSQRERIFLWDLFTGNNFKASQRTLALPVFEAFIRAWHKYRHGRYRIKSLKKSAPIVRNVSCMGYRWHDWFVEFLGTSKPFPWPHPKFQTFDR